MHIIETYKKKKKEIVDKWMNNEIIAVWITFMSVSGTEPQTEGIRSRITSVGATSMASFPHRLLLSTMNKDRDSFIQSTPIYYEMDWSNQLLKYHLLTNDLN